MTILVLPSQDKLLADQSEMTPIHSDSILNNNGKHFLYFLNSVPKKSKFTGKKTILDHHGNGSIEENDDTIELASTKPSQNNGKFFFLNIISSLKILMFPFLLGSKHQSTEILPLLKNLDVMMALAGTVYASAIQGKVSKGLVHISY